MADTSIYTAHYQFPLPSPGNKLRADVRRLADLGVGVDAALFQQAENIELLEQVQADTNNELQQTKANSAAALNAAKQEFQQGLDILQLSKMPANAVIPIVQGGTGAATLAAAKAALGITDPTWANVQNKPNTLGGYGINDAVTMGTSQEIPSVKGFANGTNFRKGIDLCGNGANSGAGAVYGSRCIAMSTDTARFGGPYDDHSAFLIHPYMGAGWNSGEMRVAIASGPGSYATNVPALIISNGGITANNFNMPSDIKFKKGIETIGGALDKVKRMRGVYYVLKADKTASRKAGVIAQEMMTVFPEVVGTTSDSDGGKSLSVSYPTLVSVLIEAVKELSAKVDALEGGR